MTEMIAHPLSHSELGGLLGNPSLRMICLTAGSVGEGVTTCAWSLASTLAERYPGEVLVCDANPERPDMSRAFNAADHVGVANVFGASDEALFTQLDQAVWRNAYGGPDFLAAGKPAEQANASGHRDWADLLVALRKRYRYILLDCPPITPLSHAQQLARACDGAVLVVAAHSAKRMAILAAARQLSGMDVKLVGTIYNRRRYPIPNWIYKWL